MLARRGQHRGAVVAEGPSRAELWVWGAEHRGGGRAGGAGGGRGVRHGREPTLTPEPGRRGERGRPGPPAAPLPCPGPVHA